ncbi:chitin disaccharide deacetylase [Lentibacillus saliphilus]|uniref:chitin disaccharide deacetylase n=1 Tax=Lentibacillus saliphilus TaxID=2737028 RepID=UPI001C3047F2|nr:chitin disaccharide deacetylase [Lentibacillus saliphilus]
MKVLFNADDFGLTKGVTDGIIHAHTKGVVGATTLMMNGRATDYAVRKAKAHPSLKIGIHLVLTWGKPISNDVTSLVDENGLFKFKNTFASMEPPNVEAVRKEWMHQIEAFLETGLKLHHIDSHHHVHGWPPLKDIVINLAQQYNVKVRYVDSLKDEHQLLLTETLYTDFYEQGVNDKIFNRLQSLDTASVEVMTHPAYVDQDLQEISSYLEKREEELAILTSLNVPDWANIV